MKKSLIALIMFIIFLSFGCNDQNSRLARQQKYGHEERMAEIKARGKGMSQEDKEQLADMIADKVVERLKQEQQ